MGKKSEEYYALYRLTNNWTGEVFEARGLKVVTKMAGIKTLNRVTLEKTKKWNIEQIGDPLEWDEAAYRQGLYKTSKHRYKTYEERKALRDPLFEQRKRARLNNWKNIDGSQFTAEQHNNMLQFKCEVCQRSDKKICVDHDHNTGIVRGTLCVNCNLALGNLQDNPILIYRLASYLEEHDQKTGKIKNND